MTQKPENVCMHTISDKEYWCRIRLQLVINLLLAVDSHIHFEYSMYMSVINCFFSKVPNLPNPENVMQNNISTIPQNCLSTLHLIILIHKKPGRPIKKYVEALELD